MITTEFEYQKMLTECIEFKNWQVVTDAITLLNTMNYNYKALLVEVKAEWQTIIKMLQSDASDKQKLDFVKSFAKDWGWKGENENEC